MKGKKFKLRPLSIVCVVIVIFFILYCAYLLLKNDAPPIITVASDLDKISVEVQGDKLTELLMDGVTAVDKEDGDVTDSIIIEGISSFDSRALEESQTYARTVTYVAFDSAGNVTKYQRQITYTDYHTPEITADSDLTFTIGTSSSTVLSHLHCIDPIDGDISDQISLQQNSTIQTSTVGIQTLTFEVSNSCGDTAYATFDIKFIS